MKLELLRIFGQGMVTALAPVQRGRYTFLVAAARDGLLVFGTKKMLLVLAEEWRAHGELIAALCAEPKASRRARQVPGRLASAACDGSLIVWVLSEAGKPTAQQRLRLEVPVHDLSWAADEPGWIAAALDDGRVGLWSPRSGEQRRLGEPGPAVRSVDFFPDGKHLLAAGDDGLLRVFRLPGGEQAEGGLLRHYNAIRIARVSSCGRYIAFLSGDEKGAIFDLDRRESSAFGQAGDPVVSIAWHPTEPRLAGGTERGRGFHYDLTSAAFVHTASAGHIHPAEAVAWAPDGGTAFTAGRDGRIRALGLAAGKLVDQSCYVPVPGGYALAVAWTPDASRVAAAYSDGNVALWGTAPAAVVSPSAASSPSPAPARASPPGASPPGASPQSASPPSASPPSAGPSAAGFPGPDPSQPVRAGAVLLEKAHSKPVYGLAVSPDGRCLASGSVDKTVKVWDLGERLQAHDLHEIHDKPVYAVSFSPDSRMVATGSGDTYLVVYDLEQLKKKAQEAFGAEEFWHFAVRNRILNCVAWSPDGKQIAVGLSNHTVVVLRVDDGGKVVKGPTLSGHEDSVSRVAWGKDGRVLVSAGYDRRVVVWDRSDFRPLCSRLVEHEEPIQALAVHPSGELLCTGSWDGTIRLFGVELLDQRGVFSRPPFSAVESLCWSGDGALLCAGSSDGTVTIWRACR